MTANLKISIGQHSDKGVKADNEDFFGYSEPQEPQLSYKGIVVAIADGMSSSDAGKKASHACIVGFLSDYYSTPDSWSVTKSCQQILSATNSWLYSQGQNQYGSNKGMVSTLSILILKSNTAHILHIGDSRIYRLRNGEFEQLTRDHRVWVNKDTNYLSRAMGIDPILEVDHKKMSLAIDDIFVLTTDGAHDFIADKEIKQLLLNNPNNLQQIAETIVDRAKTNNSDDNLTCQIVKIGSLPDPRQQEVVHTHSNIPFPPLLDSGMILDGYRIEAELHASKRTQIYRAYDTRSDHKVILKTPSVNFEDDPTYIEHFLHEEWAGKRLNHTNILKILDTDRAKSCLYYVTEYIQGPTLREWMNDNPHPDIKTVRKIIEQIAKGLNSMHNMEMLHQDLKPENIMFDQQGTVKIIDYGSVKIAGIAEISPLEQGDEENVLGTLNYTAPEYHLGQTGTVSSDLYSLGTITYEMLNGTLPYGKDMPEQPTRMKLSKLVYTPSFVNNPLVPNWIDGALKKATALDPHIRYQYISEFIYDLANPNTRFSKAEVLPLMQRNPTIFWKTVCALLLVSNLFLLYFLNR